MEHEVVVAARNAKLKFSDLGETLSVAVILDILNREENLKKSDGSLRKEFTEEDVESNLSPLIGIFQNLNGLWKRGLTNVFEGEPDERQSESTSPNKTAGDKLFKAKYAKLTPYEVDLHDRLKAKAAELIELYQEVENVIERKGTPSRKVGIINNLASNSMAHVILGVRSLEDSVYRVVKALTAGDPE